MNDIIVDENTNWNYISTYQKLSEQLIDKYSHKVNWNCISECQKLSEEFISNNSDKVNWYYISEYQKLSEEFITKYSDKVYWGCISTYQKLSEQFISNNCDEVNWYSISKYQKLSEQFISNNSDKVNWNNISIYQKLSEQFITKYSEKLDKELLEDNWNYKDSEYKKQQVVATNLYDCHEDHFIGYKGVRSDRYSRYNFQYQYLANETYESWCDCSENENSFGLSVWTYDKAKEYCDELVIKVKVNYSDVGRVVHDGGKIRCFKFTTLD